MKLMKLLASFLTVTCAMPAFAFDFPVVRFGGCPTVPFQSKFTLKEYLGNWYEIERFPAPFERGQCIRAQYSLKDSGKVNVLNRYIDDDGVAHTATGEAYAPDPNKPAILSVKFESNPFPAEYRVVVTDYSQFSLVTSCTNLGLVHVEFAWILSRDLNLSQSIVTRLKRYLGETGFDVSKFKVTNQTGCSL